MAKNICYKHRDVTTVVSGCTENMNIALHHNSQDPSTSSATANQVITCHFVLLLLTVE